MDEEDGDSNDPDHHQAEANVCIQVLCVQVLMNYLHLKNKQTNHRDKEK